MCHWPQALRFQKLMLFPASRLCLMLVHKEVSSKLWLQHHTCLSAVMFQPWTLDLWNYKSQRNSSFYELLWSWHLISTVEQWLGHWPLPSIAGWLLPRKSPFSERWLSHSNVCHRRRYEKYNIKDKIRYTAISSIHSFKENLYIKL